jgi:hypothetical protein
MSAFEEGLPRSLWSQDYADWVFVRWSRNVFAPLQWGCCRSTQSWNMCTVSLLGYEGEER